MSQPCTQIDRIDNLQDEIERVRKEIVGNGDSRRSLIGRIARLETMVAVLLSINLTQLAAIGGVVFKLIIKGG
ncbi:MAG: hypothetical protein K8R90_05150 [Candidatus Cloacimonetes bacterium]|nr:hypothetical protein [Candidatus Cloacimonadota bacterium]